jgi:hypothetical protein
MIGMTRTVYKLCRLSGAPTFFKNPFLKKVDTPDNYKDPDPGINGKKYIEQRKLTLDHKKKYQNLKQYHKEYNIINSERISENYYKNKRDKISENYYRYKRPEVHQKYLQNNYNLCIQDNEKKELTVYFGFKR